MKRSLFMLLCLLMFFTSTAFASSSHSPDPNRQTIWNNLTDGIHTLGQSPIQAKRTKQRLHNARRITRQKSIKQAKRQAWLNGRN